MNQAVATTQRSIATIWHLQAALDALAAQLDDAIGDDLPRLRFSARHPVLAPKTRGAPRD